MASLQSALGELAPAAPPGLIKVLCALGDATARIARKLCTADAEKKAGTRNVFGDAQLEIDVSTDQIVFDALTNCGAVATASSEETVEERPLGGNGYSVGFDPLDGSSIVDANFSVGSIFAVWPGSQLLGRCGREQAASAVSIYGPRTTMAVALPAESTGAERGRVIELTLQEDGTWVVTRPDVRIQPGGKVFAPGNLRATADNAAYMAYVQRCISERYTLRYTGGMVPDIYHILMKGKGVFTNVPSPAAKAKLRLLYECASIALLVECAGGASLTAPPPTGTDAAAEGACSSVLDVVVTDLDVRLGVCYGSTEEVELFRQVLWA